MQLTRLSAFTLLGFALGVMVALGVPHLANVKLPVSAQSGSGGNPSSGETAAPQSEPTDRPRTARSRRVGQMFQNLNLTPDQMQKLKSIRQEYKERIREQQRSVREARQGMQQMFSSNTPSSKVLSQFQAMQQQQQSLNQLRFRSLLEIREVLTPTQRQQLAEQMSARPSRSQRKGLLNQSQP